MGPFCMVRVFLDAPSAICLAPPWQRRKKMAIRLRQIDGKWEAFCAAESNLQLNDAYINDGMHTALSEKFFTDFKTMGFIKEENNE
jgi:hypothetical protein